LTGLVGLGEAGTEQVDIQRRMQLHQ